MKKQITLAVLLSAAIGGSMVYFNQFYPERAEVRKLERLLERKQHFDDVKVEETLEKFPAERLRILAEKGNAAAQFQLAEVYRKNSQEEFAKKWYEKAAAQDYADAYLSLAFIEKDKREEYLDKAIQLGSLEAKEAKALDLYSEGDNLSAIMLWNEAAEAGYPLSQVSLGTAYFYGDGVSQSWKKAFYWYNEAYKNIKLNNSSDYFLFQKNGKRLNYSDIYQNLAMLYLLGLGTDKKEKMVEELIDKCKTHISCEREGINNIIDFQYKLLERKDLPDEALLNEEMEWIKRDIKAMNKVAKELALDLIDDPKVLIDLGKSAKDKSKAKEYFGKACDLRSQEGCDKYRELNEKEAERNK